jgi:ubiquinone/menaquinone biosynthesis C-methylase UbiE
VSSGLDGILEQQMNREQIRGVYDQRAPAYDRTVGRGERWLLGDLRAAFGATLRGETLEVAAGSGLNLPYYTGAVTRAVAVDLSRGMLDQAARRARDLRLRVAFAQMDAQRLAFRDNNFDTVAISLSLCTVPDPAAALREMARVCRPDGRIVLLEHVLSPVWPVALLERILSPLQERSFGCHLTRRTIETAREMGFQIESERGRLFDVFRLVVARPPDRS